MFCRHWENKKIKSYLGVIKYSVLISTVSNFHQGQMLKDNEKFEWKKKIIM